MKKNNQILLSWLVIAITLITSFSSCAIDNPLQPFDDGGGPYVFKDEMDPTVKPGDDFYNYVLGTWLKENDYNLCHEDRGTMIQQYILGIDIDVWYDIFGVTSQDKMYIAPENRIHIW